MPRPHEIPADTGDREARAAHLRALALMVCAACLWSIAGVITRKLSPDLQANGRYEIVFWRSAFAALCVGLWLAWLARRQGARMFLPSRPVLLSGVLWGVMFSFFMFALTLTTVANTLVVLGLGPLVTALIARAALGTPIPGRTRVAIAAASIGIAWMFAQAPADDAFARHAFGMLIALMVPLAGAVNWVTLAKTGARVDLVPAVLVGGLLSAAIMLPLAVPFRAGGTDIALLALLGSVQLALPCVLLVVAARRLAPPEIALIALLEIALGPLWAWWWAGEPLSSATVIGGSLVLAALVANEAAGLRARRFVGAAR